MMKDFFSLEAMTESAVCLSGIEKKREMSGGTGREKGLLINDNRTTLLPCMDMIACMSSLKPCIM
jgi:hypothetical protein